MRRASWACCAIDALRRLAAITAAAACCVAAAADDGAVPLHITAAAWFETALTELPQAAPELLAPLPAAGWGGAMLPHARAAQHAASEAGPAQAGANAGAGAAGISAWYRFAVPARLLAGPEAAVLYVPRCFRCAALSVYIDGRLAQTTLDRGVRMHFNEPQWLALPQRAAAQAGAAPDAEVILRLDATAAAPTLLSTLWLGSQQALGPSYAARELLQRGIPAAASAAFVFLGIFALLVWLRRRNEPGYLLFFALSLLYWLRCIHYYASGARIMPMLAGVMDWITVNALGWMMIVAYLFSLRLHGHRQPLVERPLIALQVIATLLTLPGTGSQGGLMRLATALIYPSYLLVAVGITLLATRAAWQGRSTDGAWVAASLWLNIALGAHDYALQRSLLDTEGVFLLPLGGVAMCSVFGFVVWRRYMEALRAAEQANAQLGQRLAQREQELQASFAQLREAQRQQVLASERQRLMREMHDGLGATLMSSLVAVQSGQMGQAAMAEMLRESVDELKIAIDSLDPAGNDVLVLLGTLRWRLGPRLEAAGLTLQWQVGDLPPLPWLTAADALHVLRIVQEVLTNIVKHAGASEVLVRTTATADAAVLHIHDNGRGLPPAAAAAPEQGRGRGLRNMQHRAAQLGGRLHMHSQPGQGTQVTLHLPLARAAQAG